MVDVYKRQMFTMGDVALCSERNEDLLYKLFGKNAELLIDHEMCIRDRNLRLRSGVLRRADQQLFADR